MVNPFELIERFAPKPTIGDRLVGLLIGVVVVIILLLAGFGAYTLFFK